MSIGDGEVDGREIVFVEKGLEDEEDSSTTTHSNLHRSRQRRVQFKDGEALVAEFDDSNLWAPGKCSLWELYEIGFSFSLLSTWLWYTIVSLLQIPVRQPMT